MIGPANFISVWGKTGVSTTVFTLDFPTPGPDWTPRRLALLVRDALRGGTPTGSLHVAESIDEEKSIGNASLVPTPEPFQNRKSESSSNTRDLLATENLYQGIDLTTSDSDARNSRSCSQSSPGLYGKNDSADDEFSEDSSRKIASLWNFDPPGDAFESKESRDGWQSQ